MEMAMRLKDSASNGQANNEQVSSMIAIRAHQIVHTNIL